jgi:hypothetical protein
MRNFKIKLMETQLLIFFSIIVYAFTSMNWKGFVKAIVDICCWCLCWSVMYKLFALIAYMKLVPPFVLTGWCYIKV